MIVDCGECVVRGDACSDCVVSVLLGTPAMPRVGAQGPSSAPFAARRLRLEQDERAAMETLADAGLVPHLRLVGHEIPAVEVSQRPHGDPGSEHAAG
ncbi:MAG: hypothetical protein WBF79_09335 [Rhodococcus sp. (in: high G+C Gram-positive bacteria)]